MKLVLITLFHLQENIDDYDTPAINVSRVKPELLEEDEYEHDSVYESHVQYPNDINIKSECPDFDEEFDENYYDDEDTSNVPYSFRTNETVAVDVMLSGNNDAQSIQINCGDDINIPPVTNYFKYLCF